MDKELKCPKCGSEKRVESGFNNKKQRYLCKECRGHYTVSQRGYPKHIKRKAIQLYLEGNGFRRIERILKVSHVSVALLKFDMHCKMEARISNLKARNAGATSE